MKKAEKKWRVTQGGEEAGGIADNENEKKNQMDKVPSTAVGA